MKMWGRRDDDPQVDHSRQMLEQIASGILKLFFIGVLNSEASSAVSNRLRFLVVRHI
jgi:hypothetical protein